MSLYRLETIKHPVLLWNKGNWRKSRVFYLFLSAFPFGHTEVTATYHKRAVIFKQQCSTFMEHILLIISPYKNFE